MFKTRSEFFMEIHPSVLKFLCRALWAKCPQKPFHYFCTEIEHASIGQLRAHPNYQGGGPWQDWVMVRTDRYDHTGSADYLRPASIHGFLYASSKFPISTKQAWPPADLYEDILAVVRYTDRPLHSETAAYESILLDRYAKAYCRNGDPHFGLVPVSRFERGVLVFEDFPGLQEFKEDWRCGVNDLIAHQNLSTAVQWYEGLEPLTYHWNNSKKKGKESSRDADCIEKDWCYVVKPYSDFADLFCEKADY
jgi:hypothetical protein